MKRFIPTALIMAIILYGCGNTDDIEIISDGSFAETTTETTAPDIVISEYTVTSATTATTEPNVYGITTEPAETYTIITETGAEYNVSSVVQERMNDMSLHEKVCQMFIATPESVSGYDIVTYDDDIYRSGYNAYPVGGIILFAQNIESSDQLSAMISDMQNDAVCNGTGAFMAVDEEGGSITRVQSELGISPVYDMNYYGNLNDYDTAFSVGASIGSYLSDYGFNLDFAPVADVNINPYNELGSRIFSSDSSVVASMSGAVVDGLQSKGICTTLKHFPGLGAGDSNTHYGSVWIDRTYDELMATEFEAFRGGIDAGSDFVMVGHQIVSAAGDDMPSDLSHVVVTDWLRGELGFNGIIITDSQAMGAISNVYTSSESAILAIEAGVDIVLMPYNLREAVDGVEWAVQSGRISESRIDESVARILEKKYENGIL